MTATATPVAPAVASAAAGNERPEAWIVRVLAAKELRAALNDRWLWMYGAAFAVLAGAITSLAAADRDIVGAGGFGRTASSLVALVQLVVPLMGLTIGARSIAGQRERGTLNFLLAHPVSPVEAYLGLFVGNVAAIAAAVCGGFGVAGLVAAVRGAAVDGFDLVAIAALSWLLAVAMIGVGMAASALTSRSSTAMGAALVLWLAFVLLGNLGIMGSSVATGMSEPVMFATAVANPVEAFRLAAMSALGGSLDVLGPVGTYAVDRFGGSVGWVTSAGLLVWAVVPVLAGAALFRRRPL